MKRWFRVRRPVDEQARLDVDAELAFHLEMRARELEEAGHAPAEARARAEREFGDVEEARRSLRLETVHRERRSRRSAWWDELRQDVRVGARVLRTNPLFTLVAVVTLALGVGANTAMFAMVHAVLFRSLPFAEPDRLVQVWETRLPDIPRNVVSRGNYMDWRDEVRVFDGLAAYMLDFGYGLTGNGEPDHVIGAMVTPSLFEVLGASAQAGRTFSAEEGEAGGGDVVLLSDGLWRTRFGADPDVIGRSITIDGSPVEVVGVMPPTFAFPSRTTEIWLSQVFRPQDRDSRGPHMLHVIGRLADGETVESARAAMQRFAVVQAERFPEAMNGWSADVQALRADITRTVRPALLVLLSAVGLVLLVACANVANLMLARSIAREKEVAVRAALGAGRARLVRQFLTESSLLAMLGGVAGVTLGALVLRLVTLFDPGDVPLIETARIDGTVLVFAVAASGLALFIFALLPAVRGSGADLQSTLRESVPAGGSVRHGRVRSLLLAGEVAVAVVLLVGAGLLLRSLAALRSVDAGLDPSNVLAVSLNLPVPKYGARERQVAFYGELVDRLRALPGVMDAAGTSEPPIVGFEMTRNVRVEGYAFSPGEREDMYYRAVTPDFFATLRIPVLGGRAFTHADRDGAAPVVIVNEAMATRYWPGRPALGGKVRLAEDGPWYDVIGIVRDVRQTGLERQDQAAVYAPYAQKDWNWLTWMTLVVRTSEDPLELARPVRDVVWSIDPDLPIREITSLESLYGESMARRRFTTTLLVAFALLAIALASVGVYGVIGYAVAQRTREIGVRIALGAGRGQLIGMVVGAGLRLMLIGAAAGVLFALLATRVMRHQLFGIEPSDPITYAGGVLFVTLVTIAACWLPARRAARIEPLRVLRME